MIKEWQCQLFLCLACLVCSIGVADEAHDDGAKKPETAPLLEWNFATYSRYGAAYPGASENQFNIVPMPFPIYRGKFWRLGEDPDKPVRGRLFQGERVRLDLDFSMNFGVDSDDVDIRRGMPDLDLLTEGGPELEIKLRPQPAGGQLYLSLPIRAAISWDGIDPSFEGLTFNPQLTWKRQFSDTARRELRLRVAPLFGTRRYMNYFYGVAREFSAPNRPAYKADAGYLGTSLGLSARRQFASNYEVVGGVQFRFLQGASNGNSALLEDDVNLRVFFAFLWKFWESDKRVPVDR